MCKDIADQEMYRPLPDNLTVKESMIEGIGLFATDFIPCGTELGLSHIQIDTEIIRTPIGGFYNHSLKPNAEKIQKGWNKWYLVTTKDINVNEEILVTYTFHHKLGEKVKGQMVMRFLEEN